MIKRKLRYYSSLRGTKRMRAAVGAGLKPAPTTALLLAAAAIMLGLLFFINSEDCFAQVLSSTELINSAKQYDGQEVVYQGEVVGEVMRRPPHAWVNVHDGLNAIGIWAGLSLIQDITYAGAYQVRGDIIEVIGVFHRACLEHGGDLDIHAANVTLKEGGKKSLDCFDSGEVTTAALLLGVLVLIWILNQLRGK
ncbi:MAG: DNA-binding protein [Candidatus Omnitrophota bacterium]|nr:DNA-binding protein [Candidatus Omnitrophota bacterium]